MKRHYALAYVLCALLTACSSLGLAPAKSLSDRLAYSYGVLTAVNNTAAQEVNAGTLKTEDAEHILKIGDEARALLDGAKSLLATGDEAGANNKLVLATAILTQLQTYLREHKA